MPLSVDLTATDSYGWRAGKIRSIWRELHFGGPPLSGQTLEAYLSSGDWGDVDSGAQDSAYILAGAPASKPSPATMLLAGKNGLYWPHCTAVLTRPNRILTARHCIESLPDRSEFKVYHPLGGLRQPARDGVSFYCTNSAQGCSSGANDLASIRLQSPFEHVPLATPIRSEVSGRDYPAWAQGFGNSNPILTDRGILLQGLIDVAPCSCGGSRDQPDGVLCFRVQPCHEGRPCGNFANFNGHSGGPMFDTRGPPFSLLGIASQLVSGCDAADSKEGRYVNLADPRYEAWLADKFCGPSCQSQPAMQPGILLSIPWAKTAEGGLDAHDLRVPSHSRLLVITLNHEIDGFHPEPGVDLDLELPPTLDAECSRYYGVEVCTIRHPDPGQYIIGVRELTGHPAYQLAAVSIGGAK